MENPHDLRSFRSVRPTSFARLLVVALLFASAIADAAGPEASVLRRIAFDGFTANEVYPADLDNDGRLELLCLQSPGIYQSEVFNGTVSDTPAEMRGIFCLTAINLEGKVLWRLGAPNLKFRQANSHVADQMVWCGLLADAAKPEVAVIKGSALLILDAATGATKRSADLRSDNYGIVLPIHTQSGQRLLVQNTEKSYAPYQYSSPAQIFDAASLRTIATIPEALGSGHSPRAVDLDGDGNDEILLGYDAYDANGARLWRVNDLGNVNPVKNHVDQLQIGAFGPPHGTCIVYAGSSNALMASDKGKLVWKDEFGHPQHVLLGDFRMGEAKASIAIYCCRDLIGHVQQAFLERRKIAIPPKGNRNNIVFLNPAGEVLNVIFPPDLKYHSGEGILLYPQGCPDGSDAVITRDWPWPESLDMAGNCVFSFPRLTAAAPANENYPAGPGPDGYGVRIADFDSDGRAEVLIHDQTTAWIYKPPYPADGVSHRHDKLKPITGQGNYGLRK